MKTLISAALWLLLVAAATPVSANHDQGQAKSQDHLHRKSGPEGAATVAQVPAPSSMTLFTVGAATLIVGAVTVSVVLRRRTAKTRRR